MAKTGKTVLMFSPRAFKIMLGKESGHEHKIALSYPSFAVQAGDNQVPEELVTHPGMKSHGVRIKSELTKDEIATMQRVIDKAQEGARPHAVAPR